MNKALNIICSLAMAIAISTGAIAQEQAKQETSSSEKMSKQLLIHLSREQSKVLCQSDVFTQCMGFNNSSCLDLSEKAVQQCLEPLPDTINLAELQNDSLEACPQQVYAKAGYPDEKAQACLQEALKQ